MRGLCLAALLLTSCSGSPPTRPAVAEQPAAGRAEGPGVDEPAPAAVASSAAAVDIGAAPPDTWIQEQLEADPKAFGALLADPARYRLQILVSLIEDVSVRPAVLEEHGYRVGAEFIYPASSIKTFASVAALGKLQTLAKDGNRVDLSTPLALCRNASVRCTDVDDDTNLAGGTITLGHEIRKMQLVSDNRSFNRLYDFVGHRELNEMLWSLGFDEVRIHHRMFGSDEPAVRRTTPRMELRPPGGKPVVIERRVSDLELPPTPAPGLEIGAAYYDEDRERIEGPMSFADKNYASVRDLHRLTVSLVMPDAPGAVDLGLSEEHRRFLLDAMTEDPLQSTNPVYTKPINSGLRYKTMLRGMMRVLPGEQIRYTNKPGRAFGFHLDSAYVENRSNGRALFVTAVIYGNTNDVLNDNEYDYDEVTRPFLKNLGEVLARRWLAGPTPPAR